VAVDVVVVTTYTHTSVHQPYMKQAQWWAYKAPTNPSRSK